MAIISHKNVSDDLATRLKLAALHSRKTVRDYTLDALTDAVARDLDAPGEIDPNIRKAVASAAAPVQPASSLPRPSHDPETCRLRGCGMCAALGVTR